MFSVPEEWRITSGPLQSSSDSRNNGAFAFPANMTPRNKILRAIVSDGGGWEHVSVSVENRAPYWDEMCFIKSRFWGPEDVVMQLHPKESEYVNCHPFTLHLWRPMDEEIRTPPPWMVGPK